MNSTTANLLIVAVPFLLLAIGMGYMMFQPNCTARRHQRRLTEELLRRCPGIEDAFRRRNPTKGHYLIGDGGDLCQRLARLICLTENVIRHRLVVEPEHQKKLDVVLYDMGYLYEHLKELTDYGLIIDPDGRDNLGALCAMLRRYVPDHYTYKLPIPYPNDATPTPITDHRDGPAGERR